MLEAPHSQNSRPIATVDLRLGRGGDLHIQWTDAPGHEPRTLGASHVARILACMQEVHAAEQAQRVPQRQAAWLAASRELVALLDGPERVLLNRVEAAERQGYHLVVAVRALADHQDVLREHPATRMHWQLLSLADATDHGRSRFHAVLQLDPRMPRTPNVLPFSGLRILYMAFAPQDVFPVLDFEGEEERYLELLAPFVSEGRALVRIVEDGTLEDLARALLVDHYDVVHLSGHGVMTPEGPRLVMEDDTGMRRRRDGKLADVSPAELIEVLGRGAVMPALVVLSNCHSAETGEAMPSFAVELVAARVPAVLGWSRPVRDDQATAAMGMIFQQLAAGKLLVDSVELARSALRRREQQALGPDGTWATLVLLTSNAAGFRVDRQAPPLPEVVRPEEDYKFLASGHMKVLQHGFVGRRRPLQRLVRVLRDGKYADRDGAELRDVAGVVIWGMKGVGKSCLVARAVDRTHQHSQGLGRVVLHGVLGDTAVITAFQKLALEWEDADAEKILSNKDLLILHRVRRVLARWRARPLVFILDDFEQNVEIDDAGPAHLRSYAAEILDALLPACKVGRAKMLITTTATFAIPMEHAGALGELRLGTFEPSSVRKLWMRGPSSGPHIPVSLRYWESLAARLGSNARILSWARDLLAGKTPDELAAIGAQATEQVPVWQEGDTVTENKHEALVRLFLSHMAYEAVYTHVGPDAREFLRRARVYTTAVPALAFTDLTEGLSIILDDHLVVLANYGLLEVGDHDGQRAYRVNPLIEANFSAERPRHWHAVAARYWMSASRSGKYLDPIRQAWHHSLAAYEMGLAEQAGRILWPTLRQAGRYQEGLELAEEHLRVFPDSAYGLHWAGDAEIHAARPTERAESRLRAALERWEAYRGPDWQRDIAGTLFAIGSLLRDKGEANEALAIHSRALALQIESYGTEVESDVAASHHALGLVYQALDRYPEARLAFEHALTIHSRLGREDWHPEYSASLHALGTVLRALNDLDGARRAIERSILIKSRTHTFGTHPGDAAGLHTLGGILHAQGHLKQARSVLEKALLLHAEFHGAGVHPNEARTLGILAEVLLAQGDRHGARISLERSHEILYRAYGTEVHPDVARSLYRTSSLLMDEHNFADARSYLERARDIWIQVRGPDGCPDLAAVLLDLGFAMLSQGDIGGAREALECSLAMMKTDIGIDMSRPTIGALCNLASVYISQGDPHEAVALLRRALEIQSLHRDLPGNQRLGLEIEAFLASILVSLGESDQAWTAHAPALRSLAAMEPNHPLVCRLASFIQHERQTASSTEASRDPSDEI